jgi:hypothetical protein
MYSTQSKSLPWDVVEKAIVKEVKWLKETIIETPYKDKGICKDCIYRRLAILILSGKIKVKDIKSTVCLWGKEKLLPIGKPHGKKWHAETMRLVNSYFKSLGYDVIIEPNLNMGRADLGVYKRNERNLFIEIGTVSLSKLLFNLESTEGSDFLLVLDSNHAVEFSILKADFKHQTI